MPRHIGSVLLLVLATCPAGFAQGGGQIDPTKLVWSNCGACPDPVELVASGATVIVGVAGRAQGDQQNQALHMASTQLPPAASYKITFFYDLTTWDSYNAPGTPNPPFNGGTGYWDSFSVSLSSQPYWQLTLSDPLTSTELPGLGFLWGGSSYGGNNPAQNNAGTTTITVKGNPNGTNYLNVGLDTATFPDADTNFPSWGTFTIQSIVATCSGDIADITSIPKYFQCGNTNYNPYYHQPPAGQPGAWWALTYDHSQNGTTICDVGCALTAYAMVLSEHGFPYDPGSLNSALNNLGAYGFNSNQDVVWGSASFLSGNNLEVKIEGPNTASLDSDLCGGNPAILQVTSPTSGGSHFVVAIGKTNGVYDIIDPGHINVTTLDYYGNAFTELVRFIPPGSGAFIIYADATVQFLVTDPLGRQVGFSGGTTVNQIPGAYYGSEQLAEDDPGSTVDHGLPTTRFLFIPYPPEGFYQVQVIGMQAGPANLQIYRYNKNNLPETIQNIQTNLAPGQIQTETLTYSTRKGDVNGDGFVNDLDLAIVKASLGTKLGQPGYNPAADLNGDGIVDQLDLCLVASQIPGNTSCSQKPPATTALLSPQPNAAGWNNSDVTIQLTATDNSASGIKQITYSASGAQTISTTVASATSVSLVINTEGITTLQFFSTDNLGDVEAPNTITIKLDKTPPTITGERTPPPNANGWNNATVTVSFQCADAISGLASGSPPASTVLSSEVAGQSVTGTCTDVAGNSASATVSGVNIDKTPPTVACSASPNVLWPPNNMLVPTNVSVNVSDALSGPGGFTLVSVTSNEPDSGQGDIQGFVTGTASTSGQLRAARLGSGTGRVYTFTYSGSDKAGNTASCRTTVTVPHDQGQN